MIKTLKNLFKQDKEKFVVPKSVQSVIPIKTIWEDGVFLVGKNKYAKTFKFEDINYAVASREDKEAMFLEYSELLNALDSGATTKITINNRRLNKADFEQTILIPMADDGLDKYRKEYNKMLLDKATGANAIVQDKYVTVSVCKKNIEEARNYFARVGADLIGHFNRLGSKCVELDAGEKLRIFHDFYRTGEETGFAFDMLLSMRKGHDFKDYICPDTFEFEKDYFRIGDRYGRVIFLREYAAYIKDSMVAELCELNRNMMLSVDVVPVPTDEAVREVENRLLGVETNITNWQRKQNQNNNFSAVIPYDLEQQRKTRFNACWFGEEYPKATYNSVWQKQHQIYHPTIKNVECLSWLIQISSLQGELVFDGFMGTGSTALAAIQTQRAYLGAEIDKAYFEIAQNRIKEVEKRNVTNYF